MKKIDRTTLEEAIRLWEQNSDFASEFRDINHLHDFLLVRSLSDQQKYEVTISFQARIQGKLRSVREGDFVTLDRATAQEKIKAGQIRLPRNLQL